VPGLLDNYSAMMGFPSLQQPQPAQLQEFPFARVPKRPEPDLSAVHALTAQLMGRLIAPPVPPLQVQLPSTHPMSALQAMQAAAAVAAGQTPIGPMAGAQRQ
jgi:hypothetical protein